MVSPSGEGGNHDTLILVTPSCTAVTFTGLDATVEKRKNWSFFERVGLLVLTWTSNTGNGLTVNSNTETIDCCHFDRVTSNWFEVLYNNPGGATPRKKLCLVTPNLHFLVGH